MKPINTKHDLIELAARNAPTKACAVVIGKDGATVLGGFTAAEGYPGWIVRVTSLTGREWLIGVWVDEPARKYRVTYPDQVPWAAWLGTGNGRRPLIDGDVSIEASFKRMQARRTNATAHKAEDR